MRPSQSSIHPCPIIVAMAAHPDEFDPKEFLACTVANPKRTTIGFIMKQAPLALLPPLAVLLFGLTCAWVLRGFRPTGGST